MSWQRIHGQDRALKQLRDAHARRRLGQSYLFVGPDGVGKRLFTRELAKSLLCEKRGDRLEACDICPSCRQVEVETHLDLHIVRTPEGKHELPVDEMRDFSIRLARKPARGGHVVGVVEDAEEFNEESANCFLKTLEEPPPGAVLILIASSTSRQLPTILSRCQIVRFEPLGSADLTTVLQSRGIVDPVLLARIVRLAGGSAGRALALADPAIWQFRNEFLDGILADRVPFDRLAEAWTRFNEGAGKDNTAAQRECASVAIGFVTDALRQAMKLAFGADAAGMEEVEKPRLNRFADRVGPDRLLEMIDRTIEAEVQVARRVQLILVVESLLWEFAQSAQEPMRR